MRWLVVVLVLCTVRVGRADVAPMEEVVCQGKTTLQRCDVNELYRWGSAYANPGACIERTCVRDWYHPSYGSSHSEYPCKVCVPGAAIESVTTFGDEERSSTTIVVAIAAALGIIALAVLLAWRRSRASSEANSR